MGSEGLEPTTPAVFLLGSKDPCSQSGVLTKLDDEPKDVIKLIFARSFKCFRESLRSFFATLLLNNISTTSKSGLEGI